MISAARQYLSTTLMFFVGIVFGLRWVEIAVLCTVMFLVDKFITGRSFELALYRRDLDLRARVTRRLGLGNAVRLQLAAAVASTVIVMLAHSLNAEAPVLRFFSIAALLVSASIASYCGFQAFFRSTATPWDLLEWSESMPDVLFVINLLPRRASRVIGAVVRLGLGGLFLLPFVALLAHLYEVPPNLPLLIVLLVLAVFFQLGFAALSQGLFSLRWRRREIERAD